MRRTSARHPVFARVFDRVCSPAMEREVSPLRTELLDGLQGRVLEVGAGNGAAFVHYPGGVREVLAIEPERYLREKAKQAAGAARVSVSVRGGFAEALPAQTASFDAAVASVVLCTVADLSLALAELGRVLRPGGELRFFEHVRSESPSKASIQRALDHSGLWPLLAGGCHCGRNTVASIEAAGFRIERLRSLELGPGWLHTNPYVLGSATV